VSVVELEVERMSCFNIAENGLARKFGTPSDKWTTATWGPAEHPYGDGNVQQCQSCPFGTFQCTLSWSHGVIVWFVLFCKSSSNTLSHCVAFILIWDRWFTFLKSTAVLVSPPCTQSHSEGSSRNLWPLLLWRRRSWQGRTRDG
jgi:hypothetical protein